MPGVQHLAEGRAGIDKHVDHVSPRIRPIVAPVGHPSRNRPVTVVDDVRIRSPQPVDQACCPNGRRRLLNPRPVRGHARRNSQHTPRTIDHPTTVRRAADRASRTPPDAGPGTKGDGAAGVDGSLSNLAVSCRLAQQAAIEPSDR